MENARAPLSNDCHADSITGPGGDAPESGLNRLTAEWKTMPPGQSAADFYSAHVFPLVRRLFVERESPKIDRPIFGLILSLGESPQPLILSISAVKPQRVLFLHSRQTEPNLDEIVQATGLKPHEWDKRLVRESDPMSVYSRIAEAWESWGRRTDIAVDYTGGTKSMSAGAVLASAFIGAQLLYVGSHSHLRERRCPEPGSEYLLLVPNPLVSSGELDKQHAGSLFRRHDYSGARVILESLADRMHNPRPYQVLAHLAAGYQSWDQLNLGPAAEHLAESVRLADTFSPDQSYGEAATIYCNRELIRSQAEALGVLHGALLSKGGTLSLLQDRDKVSTLISTVYGSALRQEERGEFDAASLLFYRLVELLSQRRLAVYGVDTSEPDYNSRGLSLGISPEGLLGRLNQVRKTVGKEIRDLHQEYSRLPSPIPLMDGYMLLEALRDRFSLRSAGISWSRLLNQIRVRNLGIYAHGFRFVSDQRLGELREMVERLLDVFCEAEAIDRSRLQTKYSFISPWG